MSITIPQILSFITTVYSYKALKGTTFTIFNIKIHIPSNFRKNKHKRRCLNACRESNHKYTDIEFMEEQICLNRSSRYVPLLSDNTSDYQLVSKPKTREAKANVKTNDLSHDRLFFCERYDTSSQLVSSSQSQRESESEVGWGKNLLLTIPDRDYHI